MKRRVIDIFFESIDFGGVNKQKWICFLHTRCNGRVISRCGGGG